jgi:hypothetical protein
MFQYYNGQYMEMIQTYRFPDRVLPSADKFQRLVRNLRNFASFKKPRRTSREIKMMKIWN